jgi:error-prone DNA polymerase
MIEFAELCAKTNFSLLRGASHPEEMVKVAHEKGLYALAIADRGGLYGSVRAHEAAKRLAQRYIVGAEVPIGADEEQGQATVLVQNRVGYRNLCRLLTRAHADRPRDKSLLDPEDLAKHADGLFLIVPVPATDASGFAREVKLGLQKEAFGSRAFLATSRNLDPEDGLRESCAMTLSRGFGLSMIATACPNYHHPERKPVADVIQCIREKTTLDRAGNFLPPNAEAYVHSPTQIRKLFFDATDRVSRTVEIARACEFSLGDIHYRFPCDDLASGDSPDLLLSRLVKEGACRRYPQGVPLSVARQIEKEICLITKLGVSPFFLSAYEIVRIAREKRILCQGRGSAANSAVCFALGITAVDPARSNLLFERFLSEERAEPPDIDIDFEHERREEVIQAIYEKYGRDRAAMVSEVTCYRGRSALRETAKAFGLSLEQATALAESIGPYDSVNAGIDGARDAIFDSRDRRIKLIVHIAGILQGFPRHMSTHVGGFVLSAEPLDEVAPIEPAKIPGRTVVPWDKDDIDALGFFKVDVLGLGMLTAIRKTLELVHAHSAPSMPFDPIDALAAIPPEEPLVYDAICRADTIGVFQIESRGQMAMLPRMLPRRFYDLVIEVAIVRPGPIQGGMVHPYLRRRNGQETASMPHPALSSILERTLGVPLFQEQVMQIAIVGAGYTAGQADELRRDMAAWRRDGRLLGHRDKLMVGFLKRGISPEFAERLFSQIKGFGEYGFPESHAASFALLVYASAWLKVHHPMHFGCALLNSQPMGFYSESTIVRDAQKHGVVVRGPDVTMSIWSSSIEVEHDPEGESAIRLGLRLVKGLGEEASDRIIVARSTAQFRDVSDLAHRAALRVDQIEALAEAGALESLVTGRRHAIWQARAPRNGKLYEKTALTEPRVDLPALGEAQQLLFDYEKLGLSVSDHPMRHLREKMNRRSVVKSDALAKMHNGEPVSVAGLVLNRQRPMTAAGVVFVTLEDEEGLVNLIVRSPVFERFRSLVTSAQLLFARGKVQRTPAAISRQAVIHILVEKIEALDFPGLAANSRDFR